MWFHTNGRSGTGSRARVTPSNATPVCTATDDAIGSPKPSRARLSAGGSALSPASSAARATTAAPTTTRRAGRPWVTRSDASTAAASTTPRMLVRQTTTSATTRSVDPRAAVSATTKPRTVSPYERLSTEYSNAR